MHVSYSNNSFNDTIDSQVLEVVKKKKLGVWVNKTLNHYTNVYIYVTKKEIKY